MDTLPANPTRINGHKVVVKLLLAIDGIEVNSKDKDGQTALSFAAENGHQEVVELLLAMDGIDINSKDKDKDGTIVCGREGTQELVKLLLAMDGINVNLEDNSGQTALPIAVEKGGMAGWLSCCSRWTAST